MKLKIEMLWVLLLILQSGSVLYLNYNKFISITFIVISIIIIFKNFNKIQINKKETVFLLIFINLLSISSYYVLLTQGFFNKGLIIYVLKFTLVFLGLKAIGINRFFRYLSELILYLSILSFIIFLMILIGLSIPITYGVIGEIPSYFYILRTTGVDFNTNYSLLRNSGLFYEPGLYQVFLNLTLIYYFLLKGNKIISIFILLIIITTLSPVGIFLAFLIISFKYLIFFKKIINVIMLGISILFAVYFIVPFLELKLTTLSFQLRYYDIKQGLSSLNDNFFWGIGFENHDGFIINSKEEFGLERKNSNGLVNLFVQNGIIFGLYFLFLLRKGLININYNRLGYLVVLILLIVQPIYSSTLLMSIVASGLFDIKNSPQE